MGKKLEDETLRLNYQLSFDAMRGYHTSELSHKRDAIIILNSFLVCIIAIYAAIVRYIDYDTLIETPSIIKTIAKISYGLSICVVFGLIAIVDKYKTKIIKENKRYEQYRNECILSRKKLGLIYQNVNTEYEEHYYWEKKPVDPDRPREGTGFVGAISIIETYSKILTIFSWLITIVICVYAFRDNVESTLTQIKYIFSLDGIKQKLLLSRLLLLLKMLIL